MELRPGYRKWQGMGIERRMVERESRNGKRDCEKEDWFDISIEDCGLPSSGEEVECCWESKGLGF